MVLDGELVCACLVGAGQADGSVVLTVEGLGAGDGLDGVQEAYLQAGAVQCGFCTPGLVLATHELLRAQRLPDRCGDPGGAGRQPVPLHRVRADPRRRAPGCLSWS